ncbi:AI-2E family transporter, partial [Oceanobacillus caeni]
MKQTSRFIKFMGGKNLLYLLVLLILIGITILIYNKISFIFHPIIVIFSTIMPPTILAFIAYYLLNPIVDFLEKFRIKRIWGIIILILGIGGLLTGLILLIAPSIEVQVKDLAKNFPNYLNHLGNVITMWLQNSFLGPYYDEGYNWFVTNFSNIPGMVGTYLVDA